MKVHATHVGRDPPCESGRGGQLLCATTSAFSARVRVSIQASLERLKQTVPKADPAAMLAHAGNHRLGPTVSRMHYKRTWKKQPSSTASPAKEECPTARTTSLVAQPPPPPLYAPNVHYVITTRAHPKEWLHEDTCFARHRVLSITLPGQTSSKKDEHRWLAPYAALV